MKDQVLSQAEIDALFAQATGNAGAPPQSATPAVAGITGATAAAQPAFPAMDVSLPMAAPLPPPVAAGPLTQAGPLPISLLSDVELEVTVQLGQTTKNVREILELGPGQVLELDRLAGDAVDILVNGRLVAKAEVVVIGENFGVRITDLVRPEGGKKQ